MRASPRRALTLIEALIAAGLLSMVLAATYAALVLSLRYQQKHEDQVSTFQEAFNAMNRMQTALGAGAAESLVYEPDDSGFVFVSAQPPGGGPYEIDSAGLPKWQKFVAFYIEVIGDDRILRLKERRFSPTSALPPVPALSDLKSDTSLVRVTVAHHVELLRIVADSGADLTLKVKSLREKDFNSITLQGRVAFRQ